MATRGELDLSRSGGPHSLGGSIPLHGGLRAVGLAGKHLLNYQLLKPTFATRLGATGSMARTASGVQFWGQRGFQLTQGTKYSDVHLN